MKNFFRFGLAMSIAALTMLAGCGSPAKSSPPAPTGETPSTSSKTPPGSGGSHTMPDGKTMDGKDMK